MKERPQPQALIWRYVAAACILLWLPGAAAASRVALVCSEENGEIGKLLDLTTAKLTAENEIELLDRASIRRVLNEQKLSLSGPVEASQAVAVGKLLAVDLFAVVETGFETNELTRAVAKVPLGLVVFDAHTGVRLHDSAVPLSTRETAAAALAKAVLAAREKHRLAPAALRTLCVLPARNADLPRDWDSVFDSVGLLLERELIDSPNVVVLERKRLEHVNKERLLPTDSPESALLASLLLVEPEIGRGDKNQGWRGTARLSRSDGSEVGKVTASVTNQSPSALAHALVEAAGVFLQIERESGVQDPAREARRFYREAEHWDSHRDYLRALPSMEAAFALAPTNRLYMRFLSGLLTYCGIELLDPGGQTSQRPVSKKATTGEILRALALANRSADLMLEQALETKERQTPTNTVSALYNAPEDYKLGYCLQKLARSPGGQTDETRAEFHRVVAKARTLRFEAMEPAWHDWVHDDLSYTLYAGFLFNLIMHDRDFFSPEPAGFRENVVWVMKRWLELGRRFKVVSIRDISEPRLMEAAVFWCRGGGTISEFSTNRETPVQAANRMEEVWRLAEQSSDPLVRSYGPLGRAAMASVARQITDKALMESITTFIGEMQALIARTNGPPQADPRNRYYDAAVVALRLGYNVQGPASNPKPATGVAASLARFMLGQKEVRAEVLDAALLNLSVRVGREDYQRWLDLIDSALGVVASPDCRMAATDKVKWRANLLRRRQGVLAACPELAPPPGEPPWRRAQALMEVSEAKNGIGWLLCPMLEGRSVYAVGLGTTGGKGTTFLQLVRIPLDGGPPALLGKLPLVSEEWTVTAYALRGALPEQGEKWEHRITFGQGSCMDASRFFLATPEGVFVFPLDGGTVERLGKSTGLPSDRFHSVACLDGALYASAGESGKEGFLIAYDLASRQCTTLASSRRHEKLSPFDDGRPFAFPRIFADKPRQRLIFLSAAVQNEGIWSFEPGPGRFTRLLHIYGLGDLSFQWAGALGPDRLMVACRLGAAQFDLATDKPTLLYATDAREDFGPTLKSTMRVVNSVTASSRKTSTGTVHTVVTNEISQILAAPTHWQDGTLNVRPPFFFHQGWVWCGWPFERVSEDGETVEAFPWLRPKQIPTRPLELLQLLPTGHEALAGDQFGLWLLELKDEKPRENRGADPSAGGGK